MTKTKRVCFTLLYSLLVLILLEVSLRFITPFVLPIGKSSNNKVIESKELIAQTNHFPISYKLRPNLDLKFLNKEFKTNSDGFRTKEFKDIDQSKFKIVGIGDSVMMGWGVSNNETYLSQLGKNLGIETINLAILGHNTTQEYFILKENIAKLKPNLVILNYVGNDFEKINTYNKINLPINSPIYIFNLAQLLYLKTTKDLSKVNVDWVPVKVEKDFEDDFYWALEKIAQLCKDHNSKFILLMDSRYVSWGDSHSSISLASKLLGIETINLYEMLRDIPESTPIKEAVSIKDNHNLKYLIEIGDGRDNHPNLNWHSDVAKILQDKVKSLIQ